MAHDRTAAAGRASANDGTAHGSMLTLEITSGVVAVVGTAGDLAVAG
ncbi:hypothetical protein ACLK19_15095 [Escherichia coli]